MIKTKLKLRTLVAAAALFAAAATPALAAESIYDTLKADPQFSTLVKAIDANGVKYQYTAKSPRTVFAPTNDAFDKIKGGYGDMISPGNASDRQNTQALLLYQIVPGRYTPESLQGKSVTVNTFQKDPVTIDGSGPKLRYGGDEFAVTQSGAAIAAANGVIIPVDGLPTPVFSQTDETSNSGAPAPSAPAASGMAPASGSLTAPQ
ncbi:MAG: fasciclin domain-containing protein [Parvibaculum sp.]|jgi:uncharacterized surface protein with fasciclin (FAS1) repeats|uniref:fasciclin domain-containing protein n=1 Tax=Parvibaculum sp. TaxID=2024848 RepID=UPI0028445A93|nr:fasciclin domain-containing protein [Parvibaculum sp.]MDR3498104.1 fasciclin domain-containing protein [Parvibaculum sp.]